ncbi:Rieske (2Fe-2S) protein [Marichromatium bheemlicum]|uniref:Non-heme iron oxygenase ferredoxin subunit n=1 Tax=Marichromatium bheemlicum TaxID=365339 RepID=A0ABX1I7A4_9GAMM|nr:non-heme iron oxygenase ferredoxin subunit [Marichromatium bheemlicum]NKN33083.1 non-heme iron oxygenase ferredoxin subunit [Marichromatium bheemlicum]
MAGPRVAARSDEVPEGGFIRVRVAGIDCILARIEGRLYAVEDNCSHEDYPLSYGCLDGARIKCSLHGSRFCLRTGQPLEAPADTPIRTFHVEVIDDQILIDPTRAGE